jgi:cardiolipin synthase
VNRRDHRKLLIVDGKVGFTGGLNIGDEYDRSSSAAAAGTTCTPASRGPPSARWRASSAAPGWRPAATASRRSRRRHRERGHREQRAGDRLGNEERKRRATIRRSYLHAMRRARESIQIMNAYFIPDRGVRRVLANAVRRGVKVAVIVPAKSDLKSVMYAGQHVYARLLKAGVRIFEWSERMLHAKTAVVDAVWADHRQLQPRRPQPVPQPRGRPLHRRPRLRRRPERPARARRRPVPRGRPRGVAEAAVLEKDRRVVLLPVPSLVMNGRRPIMMACA